MRIFLPPKLIFLYLGSIVVAVAVIIIVVITPLFRNQNQVLPTPAPSQIPETASPQILACEELDVTITTDQEKYLRTDSIKVTVANKSRITILRLSKGSNVKRSFFTGLEKYNQEKEQWESTPYLVIRFQDVIRGVEDFTSLAIGPNSQSSETLSIKDFDKTDGPPIPIPGIFRIRFEYSLDGLSQKCATTSTAFVIQ